MDKELKKLEKLGWECCCPPSCFRFKGSDRYVDLDLPYIDVYVYLDEQKYGSYLTVAETKAFLDYAEKLKKTVKIDVINRDLYGEEE